MQKAILDLLHAYRPFDETEEQSKQRILAFVASTPACTSRETLAGHLTASAWILNPAQDSVLLMHHKKLNRWLQLGGHVEDTDTSIQVAALREATEESGLAGLHLIYDTPLDIDAHIVPARGAEPEHYHYDIRFLVQSTSDRFVMNDESHNLAWVPLAAIASKTSEESILRMSRKTTLILGK